MTQDLWERNLRHFTGRVATQAHFRRLRSEEHRRMVRALMRRDPDAVEAAWRDHVWQSGIETVEYLQSLAAKPEASGNDDRIKRLSGRL
jgi:DNA-binding GntR family transcriptional regulator